jgi:hypothetical protein
MRGGGEGGEEGVELIALSRVGLSPPVLIKVIRGAGGPPNNYI